MDATLYNGNGTTGQSVLNASSFKPDLVWAKGRNANGGYNVLYDSVRGAFNQLVANNTSAETTPPSGYGVTAFNSNGFSVLDDANGSWSVNGASGGTYSGTPPAYVGWQWQAGKGTTSSNINGSITSTVSVNATAGFSIVSYTGNGTAGATVGHGLGVAPSFMIMRSRTSSGSNGNWVVYHSALGGTKYLVLNTTDSAFTDIGAFNNTNPTSSVYSVGTFTGTNGSSLTMIAYCWAPVAGFSQFGSYTGNGSDDGPFVYLGFRPKYILVKRTDSSPYNWIVWDSSMNPYNAANTYLEPNQSAAQATDTPIDFLSNGFKLRYGAGTWVNASGGTYIYAAFAENPTKFANAR
jgi:hypothetical protein